MCQGHFKKLPDGHPILKLLINIYVYKNYDKY